MMNNSGLKFWQRHEATFLSVALWVAVLLAVFSYAWTPLRASQDDWWHLKTGQWIVQHGQLPVHDVFTYTGEQTVWHNHEWLAQIVFWLVYDKCGGLFGLLTFKALFVVLTFAGLAWLIQRRCGSWIVALALAWLAAEISRRSIYIRPPLFSYAFFALTIGLFDAWKRGGLRSRWLALIMFPLMILWANLHGMCLLGIIVAGAYASGETMECVVARWRTGAFPRRQRLAFAWLLVVGIAVCCACTPAGFELFFLSGKFMNDPLLKATINEMLPPPFFIQPIGDTGRFAFIPGYFGFWFAAVAFVCLLIYVRRLPNWADFFLCGFCLFQAAFHWRLLPLFAIAGAGPAAWMLCQVLPKTPALRTRALRLIAFATVACAVYMTVLVGEPPPHTFLKRNMLAARGELMDEASYPEPLIRFIEKMKLPERMFSPLNYCGYFMWRLSPETHKLFTDNRFDIWGSKWYIEHEIILGGMNRRNMLGKSWQEITDEHGINFMVLNRDCELQKLLTETNDSAWKHIYYFIPNAVNPQHGFSLWLRNDGTSERAALIDECLKEFRSMNPGRAMP